jgi:zinc ribbon protein
MRCPNCQTENRQGRRFCAQCGLSLAPMMAVRIQQHRGPVVDFTGDNLLAEFASVVGRLPCRADAQN